MRFTPLGVGSVDAPPSGVTLTAPLSPTVTTLLFPVMLTTEPVMTF